MALIKCPECGKEVSDKAGACPSCGYPIQQKIEISTINAKNEMSNEFCGEKQAFEKEQRTSKQKNKFLIIAVAIACLSAVVIAFSFGFTSNSKFEETFLYSDFSGVAPILTEEFSDSIVREYYPRDTNLDEYYEALELIGFTRTSDIKTEDIVISFEKLTHEDENYQYYAIVMIMKSELVEGITSDRIGIHVISNDAREKLTYNSHFEETLLYSDFSNIEPISIETDYDIEGVISENYPRNTDLSLYFDTLISLGFEMDDVTPDFAQENDFWYRFTRYLPPEGNKIKYDRVLVIASEMMYGTEVNIQIQKNQEEKSETTKKDNSTSQDSKINAQSSLNYYSGTGDDVLSNIVVGSGIYRIHFTHTGVDNFIVKSYDASKNDELLINHIGNYDGFILLLGESPFSIEITADGAWTCNIEQLEPVNESSFSGKGDYVTGLFTFASGTMEFSHDGNDNFIVVIYTSDGQRLLVNEIGSYSGKKMINVPTGTYAFFEIIADGNWTIK